MENVKIIIELEKDLKVDCQGISNIIEALGILKLAEHTLVDFFNEKIGLVNMTEQ